jgi:hypothetical protein
MRDGEGLWVQLGQGAFGQVCKVGTLQCGAEPGWEEKGDKPRATIQLSLL